MRIRELDEIINYSPIPSIDEMLGYEYWEFHEAVFMLTQWPDYIVKADCKDIANIKNISRTFFYEPAPPSGYPEPFAWRFNPKEREANVVKTYNTMKQAFLSGKLMLKRLENLGINTVYGKWHKKDQRCIFHGDWNSYLFSPNNIIRWALLNGVDISEKLQNTIGIPLMRGNTEKSTLKKVKIKITGQFERFYFPRESGSFYCQHSWMREYVTDDDKVKDKYQMIHKALNELRDLNPNPKQGRPSDIEINDELYHPKAIEDIIYKDSSGKSYYYIPLLQVAMETSAKLLLNKFIDDSLPKMIVDPSEKELCQFMNDFMKNEVVALYVVEAPLMIKQFVFSFAYWSIAGFFIFEKEVETYEKLYFKYFYI